MRRISQHPPHLPGIAVGGATGCSSGAKQGCDAMGAPMAVYFKTLTAQGHRETCPDVVSESYCPEKMSAADSESFACRESRRDHGAARMRLRRSMRIIRFVGMSKHAVGERRFDRSAEELCGNDGRDLFAAVRLHELQGSASG